MCKYTRLYECFDEYNFSSRVYTFVSFIHKVRRCRRAPGSGVNLKLDATVRGRRILSKIRKLIQAPPSLPSLHPSFTSQPLNTDLWFGWQEQGGWIGTGTLAIHQCVPWCLSELQGKFWDKFGNIKMNWGPAGNWLRMTKDTRAALLSLVNSPCVLLPLGKWFLQAHWGIRVNPAMCMSGQPPLHPFTSGEQSLGGWEKSREKCSGQVEVACHNWKPILMLWTACAALSWHRTISVSAPLTLICGRAQTSLKIYSQNKAFLVTLGCSKSEWLLDWYGFLKRCSESDCDK